MESTQDVRMAGLGLHKLQLSELANADCQSSMQLIPPSAAKAAKIFEIGGGHALPAFSFQHCPFFK
jgi:hypothetical protein